MGEASLQRLADIYKEKVSLYSCYDFALPITTGLPSPFRGRLRQQEIPCLTVHPFA
jgi:hypothetical protein